MNQLTRYFIFKCKKGLEARIAKLPYSIKRSEYQARLQFEIDVIKGMSYEGYFLVVQDFINWAKSQNILVGDGRGSGAGSLAAFALGITNVDPIKYNLYFERFLNPSRVSMPDFDIDFQKDRRDEVLEYIKQKYGSDKVAQIGTFGTFKAKNAIRGIARTLGIAVQKANNLCKLYPKAEHGKEIAFKDAFLKVPALRDIKDSNTDEGAILRWAEKIEGRIASFGIHASGIVIANDSLVKFVPLAKGKNNEVVTQWDMKAIEEVGLIKFDCLGLKTLTVINKTLQYIKTNHGVEIDIQNIRLDDENTYSSLRKGDNIGIFQLEASSGIRDLTVRVKPTNVEDIAAINAIYRPGPLHSDKLQDYLRWRAGESAKYEHPDLEPILGDTGGWIIYQEQILRIAKDMAGYTLAEADLLRRAVGKKNEKEMAAQKQRFFSGFQERGYEVSLADKLWDEISAHADYSFNKCVSGTTKLYRPSVNKNCKSYSIGELYKIKYADKHVDKKLRSLQFKLKTKGWGYGYSLNEDNKLIKNKIVDIRDAGIQDIYLVKTQTGREIKCTFNHKFPTSNGIKKLEDIDKDEDLLFVNHGYEKQDTTYRFKLEGNNHPTKGQQGFQKRDTSFTQLENYIKNHKKAYCEGLPSLNLKPHWGQPRLEVHHLDGDHGNNDHSNLITLCVSCHKKTHYHMGRTKVGEKGLTTSLEQIVSISPVGKEQVYDVEMAAPYHNFVVDTGIVTSNSHALAYSILTYKTAWLKTHYPIEFMAAALTCDSDKIDKKIIYIQECKRMGIPVLPPDINESDLTFTAKGSTIRFGLSAIKNVGEAASHIIEERNKRGAFRDLFDFAERVDLGIVNKKKLDSLVLSGAFDFSHQNRATLITAVDLIIAYKDELKKYESKLATYEKKVAECEQRLIDIKAGKLSDKNKPLKPLKQPETPVKPIKPDYVLQDEYSKRDILRTEKELTGSFISGHPLDNQRKKSEFTINQLKTEEDQPEHVNLVVVISDIELKETKTKQRMAFLSLEDLTGTIDAVIFPKVYSTCIDSIIKSVPVSVSADVEYNDIEDTETGELTAIPSLKINKISLIGTESIGVLESSIDVPLKVDSIMALRKAITKAGPGNNNIRIKFTTEFDAVLTPIELVSVDNERNFRTEVYRNIKK